MSLAGTEMRLIRRGMRSVWRDGTGYGPNRRKPWPSLAALFVG